MMRLKTSAMNMLAKIQEKIAHGVRVLSPEEQALYAWVRRMKHRAARLKLLPSP